jgi:hypothetical protein
VALSLEVLKVKVAHGFKLTPQEQAFMTKMTTPQAEVSRRVWTGWNEYPDSEIDFDPDPPPPDPLTPFGSEYAG